MSKPRIAVFGEYESKQVARVRDILREQGGDPLVFDIGLGGASKPTFYSDPERSVWNGVDFSDIRAVHIRGMSVNTPLALPAVLNEATHTELRALYLREQEYQSARISFFNRLAEQGKLVVNRLTGAYVDHDTKAQLYQKLRSAGFSAPDTLMTNDPEQALAFFNKVGKAVAKPSVSIGSTRIVSDQDIERLDELNVSPVLFQELLVGDTLRVHIVADRVVLTLRIISEEGQVDSRTNTKGFEYFRLPEEEERKIVAANRYLGLHYAAWDILETRDGGYYYLDCNPGPFILWIGDDNTHTVFTALARYLVSYANTGSLEQASAEVDALVS